MELKNDNFDKSIRVVNSPSFKWMEGMLAHIPDNGNWHTIRVTTPVAETWNRNNVKDCLPDTEDPATIGCMLSLLGEQFDVDMIINVMENPAEFVA